MLVFVGARAWELEAAYWHECAAAVSSSMAMAIKCPCTKSWALWGPSMYAHMVCPCLASHRSH